MRNEKPPLKEQGDLFLRLTALQLVCCILIFALIFGAMRLNGDLFSRLKEEFAALTAADYDAGGYRFFDFGSAGEKRENEKEPSAAQAETEAAEVPTAAPEDAAQDAALLLPAAEETGTAEPEAAPVFYDMVEVVMPVSGLVTSGYGTRIHPIYGTENFHGGKDIAAPAGTAISAAMDGTVVSAGWGDTSGNYVKLAHENGMETFYCHMREVNVANGVSVRRGDVIGFVGQTGLATGPHLHFEVRIDGAAVDPDILLQEAVVVS